MTFWLDAHLDPTMCEWLGSRFKVVVKSLREIGLRDAEDVELFEAAGRFRDVVIVTKDSDFADLVTKRGKPPQVLWLRFPNRPTIAVQVLLSKTLSGCSKPVKHLSRSPKRTKAESEITWLGSQKKNVRQRLNGGRSLTWMRR